MLRPRSREIDLDHCLKCDLAWFDGGELEAWRAAGRKKPAPAEPIRFVAAIGANPLRCPACASDTLRMGSLRNTRVHHCERCGGFLAHYRPGEAVEATLQGLLQLLGLLT